MTELEKNIIFLRPHDKLQSPTHNFHPRQCFGDDAPAGNWRDFRSFGLVMRAERMPAVIDFADAPLFKAMHAVFLKGASWTETEFYQAVSDKIRSGATLWGCQTEEQFKNRLTEKLPKLLRSISDNGYLYQSHFMEINSSHKFDEYTPDLMEFRKGNYYDVTDKLNEIKVGIGKDGETIFLEGQHRLAAARLLQVQFVPVLVVFRHENWNKLRIMVEDYSSTTDGTYIIDHPDLSNFHISEHNIISIIKIFHEKGINISIKHRDKSTTIDKIGKDALMTEKSYLSMKEYLLRTKEIGGGHWANANRRWIYHGAAVAMARVAAPSSPERVLEMGTMGVNIVSGSHTIDYAEGWNFAGKTPTYPHDARVAPWPIDDKSYDLFIALRVYHHLTPSQKEAFLEAKRISRNIIIVAPESYDKVPGSKGIPLSDLIEWNNGVPPTSIMELGEEFGNLYFWDESSLSSSEEIKEATAA